VNSEEFRKKIGRTMKDVLEEGGITDEYLRTKLKKELCAKETKVFNDKGKLVYSDDLIAWEIRQRARMDAHKLRSDYPAEEHRFGEIITPRSPEEQKMLQEIAKQVAKAIREKKK
jgi:hypothetical protein